MVIYIHGFGGSGEGEKAKIFREYYRSCGVDFLAPSLSYIPELAIKTLEEIIFTCKDKVHLIGSSLGGYYSLYLANKHNLKAVLLNPAVYPYDRLQEYIGKTPNFFDESLFTWQVSHIDMLRKFDTKKLLNQDNFLLLTQKGDELLDYKEALEKYNFFHTIIDEDGNHSFKNIESKFKTIEKFFAT